MELNCKAEFGIVIGGLWTSFHPDRPIKPELISAYWLGLNDLALNAVQAAATRAMREATFFPKVAELRVLAGVASPQAKAALAWEAVKKHRGRLYSRGMFVFDDLATTATIANLGVERVYHAQGDELDVWLRKDFERVYLTLADTVRNPPPLLGICRPFLLFQNGGIVPLPAGIDVIETGLPWAQTTTGIEYKAAGNIEANEFTPALKGIE